MHFSLIPWYFDYLQSRNQNYRRHTNRVTVINDEPSTTKLQNILQVKKDSCLYHTKCLFQYEEFSIHFLVQEENVVLLESQK